MSNRVARGRAKGGSRGFSAKGGEGGAGCFLSGLQEGCSRGHRVRPCDYVQSVTPLSVSLSLCLFPPSVSPSLRLCICPPVALPAQCCLMLHCQYSLDMALALTLPYLQVAASQPSGQLGRQKEEARPCSAPAGSISLATWGRSCSTSGVGMCAAGPMPGRVTQICCD